MYSWTSACKDNLRGLWNFHIHVKIDFYQLEETYLTRDKFYWRILQLIYIIDFIDINIFKYVLFRVNTSMFHLFIFGFGLTKCLSIVTGLGLGKCTMDDIGYAYNVMYLLFLTLNQENVMNKYGCYSLYLWFIFCFWVSLSLLGLKWSENEVRKWSEVKVKSEPR